MTTSAWRQALRRATKQIWFRAAVISLFGFLLAGLSGLFARRIPYEFQMDLGQDAVGTILEIIASSMLAVTTFSLTAMVSAYGSATQLATPRATQLMMSDPTSQNALSTFLGAFVFSVVGIVGLQTGIYGGQGRVVLFLGTIVLIAVVVLTLLRWISHITAFGRMADVIDRVEKAACRSMEQFAADPRLGGRPAIAVPDHAVPVFARKSGNVTYIDIAALGRITEDCGTVVHVAALPGTMVHPARPLAFVEMAVDDELRDKIAEAFTIGRHRSFDDDPRLGLIALSEIASRALAPATNDPGTAVEVLNALLRTFLHLPADEPDADDKPLPRVYVPRPTVEEMLDDAFLPIIREGFGEQEVAVRTIKTLTAIRDALPFTAAPIRRLTGIIGEAIDRDQKSAILQDRIRVKLQALVSPSTPPAPGSPGNT
ncbi:DUF2254 domain-containing protein [Sphingomonas hankookensis]|uniref:DUF2254 domain-containing protein n=1 Tax=Sphingomonas hengshuiensis TaxID=1609977 RepID=A0A2W4ZHH0_9SPHN|nr:MAG: DUF2254 domain-containing protein [Sphingomonas hengshuiensis]